ncbi:hypothetical protein D3C87_1654380 [compost metagenome]|nr:hypothetical protein [Solitalea canadensis]
MKHLVKKNNKSLNPRRVSVADAGSKLFFHIGENRFLNQTNEDSDRSSSIRFSDKLHERWDDLFDNFDDLRLK